MGDTIVPSLQVTSPVYNQVLACPIASAMVLSTVCGRDMFSKVARGIKNLPFSRQPTPTTARPIIFHFFFFFVNPLGVFLADWVSAKVDLGLAGNAQKIDLAKDTSSLYPRNTYESFYQVLALVFICLVLRPTLESGSEALGW